MLDKKLDNRLKRVAGQLHKIQEDINHGKDCADVITQFMAVKGALAGSFEEYVKLSLNACAKNDEKKIKKLISILVKS